MKNTFLKGSGVAAIPMTMRICRRRLGVPQQISSFSIPLGATINMVGNCICLVISSLYFTHVCGVALDMEGLLILFFLVLVLSLGAPIAPGTLILCLVTLLAQLGIDTSIISLIIGINFILEMLIGMVNTFGDVIVALIVSRRNGTLNLELYNQKK
jgi:Na+/H+-dicarboxylate symporter